MKELDCVKLFPLGDCAVVIQFNSSINIETHQKIKALCSYLDEYPFEGMVEYIPAFTTITIVYDPLRIYNLNNNLHTEIVNKESPYSIVSSLIKKVLASVENKHEDKTRVIEIPVCYGGEFGPDLEYVAKHNGITSEEVIDIHVSSEYLVYMIGFAPGFPYMGGMSEKIAAPRRKSPRLLIPEGSVGIAGKQTGIYPIGTPGGWQLIGRTPIALFRPKDTIPSLLRAGDIVKFKPISRQEYDRWKEENN